MRRRARWRFAERGRGGLIGQEDVDGLVETAVQQVAVPRIQNEHVLRVGGLLLQMEAVDGVEKEERPDLFIKVSAVAAETIERLALAQQRLDRRRSADGIERPVANVGTG